MYRFNSYIPTYYAYKPYSKNPLDLENAPCYEDYVDMLDAHLKILYRILIPAGRCCIVVDDKHTNLKTEGINKNRGTHARIILMAEEIGFTSDYLAKRQSWACQWRSQVYAWKFSKSSRDSPSELV